MTPNLLDSRHNHGIGSGWDGCYCFRDVGDAAVRLVCIGAIAGAVKRNRVLGPAFFPSGNAVRVVNSVRGNGAFTLQHS